MRYLLFRTLVRNIAGMLQNAPKRNIFKIWYGRSNVVSSRTSAANSDISPISGNKPITRAAKIM